MVVCLERGADLHMAQLMPLLLTVSCFGKIEIGFILLLLVHPGSPEKGPLNVCVCVLFHLLSHFHISLTLDWLVMQVVPGFCDSSTSM